MNRGMTTKSHVSITLKNITLSTKYDLNKSYLKIAFLLFLSPQILILNYTFNIISPIELIFI